MHILHLLIYLLYSPAVGSQYLPSPRWGSAYMVKDSILYVHGGKVNPSNQGSYNSAAVTNDLIALNLSSSFQAAQPPWFYVSGSANSSTSQGPAVAFHTISTISLSSSLCFGGDGGPSMSLSTLSDSAWILNLNSNLEANWIQQPQNWASEPIRRMFHAAASDGHSGNIWITGGMKVDGSAILSDAYSFTDPPSFDALPSQAVQFPQVYGHASFWLPSGSLLVVGGVAQGNLALLSSLYLYNFTSSPSGWTIVNTTGTIPSPRRNFAGAILNDGRVLIHGGTSNIGNTPGQILSDGFILDTNQQPMSWSQVQILSALGPRMDHLVAASGSQAIFSFGWGSGGVFNNSLAIFNVDSEAFLSTWSPPGTVPSNPVPGSASSTHLPPTGTLLHPSTGTVSGTSSTSPNSSNLGNTKGSTKQHSTVIALATVLGFLALVAVGTLTYVIIKRKEDQRGGSFQLLKEWMGKEDHPDESSPSMVGQPERVHMAGSPLPHHRHGVWSFILSFVGGRKSRAQERLDMLAGEGDSQVFDPYAFPREHNSFGYHPSPRRDASGSSFGSSISNWYGLASRKSWGDFVSQPVNTLRLVGNTSYYARNAQNGPLSVNPFSDDMALREQRPTDEEENGPGPITHKFPTSQTNFERILQPTTTTLPATGVPRVSLVLDESLSLDTSEMQSTSSRTPEAGLRVTSQVLLDGSDSSSGHLRLLQTPVNPVRRSDSWWSRFSMSSLGPALPRSPREKKPEPGSIAFRDPNPAPCLIPIKEGSQSSPDTAASEHFTKGSNSRNRSRSSLKTIDSDAIERLAGDMDVIQRIETGSSRGTLGSLDGSDHALTLVSSPQDVTQQSISSQQPSGSITRSQVTTDLVLAWERRTSPENSDRSRQRSLNYGLAPRGSLFIANPDHNRQIS